MDLFLQGPLSVFCARARWGPVHVIGLRRREGGLGLTLRGDSPVLVAGVVPGGCAAVRSSASITHAAWNDKTCQKTTLRTPPLKFVELPSNQYLFRRRGSGKETI